MKKSLSIEELASLMGTTEVANELRVSSQRVRDWIKVGKLRPVQTTLGALFFPDEVQRFQRERAGKE